MRLANIDTIQAKKTPLERAKELDPVKELPKFENWLNKICNLANIIMEKKEYLKAPFKPKQNGSIECSEPVGGKTVPKIRRRLHDRGWINYLINKISG
jgi:hypothetical protein